MPQSAFEKGLFGHGQRRMSVAAAAMTMRVSATGGGMIQANVLSDPAAWQDFEAFRGGVSAHDLQGDMGLLPGPVDQAPGMAAICKGVLYERVSGPGALRHALGPVAILDIGAMDMGREQPTVGVGQDVALGAPDLPAGVVTLGAPF